MACRIRIVRKDIPDLFLCPVIVKESMALVLFDQRTDFFVVYADFEYTVCTIWRTFHRRPPMSPYT